MKCIKLIFLCFFLLITNNIFAASTDPLNAAPGFGPHQKAPYGIFQTKTLLISADFPDKSRGILESELSSIHAKVVDYYSDVSYGKATLTQANESFGQVNDGVIHITYDYNFSNSIPIKQLIRDAIVKSDSYINYSNFDNDSDGYLEKDELAIQVIITGKTGGNGLDAGSNPPVLDGVTVGALRDWAGGVAFTGECCNPNVQNLLGTIIHEYGHTIFNLHDFYGYYGISGFGIMSGGSNGKNANDEYVPTMPTPWTQLKLGWINVQEASGTESIVAMGSNLATDSNTVFKVSTNNPNQYFLIANIQDIGRNTGLEKRLGGEFEGGLVIYHIDDSVIGTSRNINTIVHRIVEIEKPGGPIRPRAIDLNTNDTFWSSNNASTFNGTSTPNSNNNDGSSTGVNINSISESGEVMTFNVGEPSSTTIDNIALNTSINGSWDSNTDSVNRPGKYAKFYSFSLSTSTTVTIDLESATDAFLYLLSGEDTQGSIITFDDDEGDGRNSRITRLLSAGTYTVEATTYSSNALGNFTLQVSSDSSGSTVPEITSHANGSTLNGSTIDFSWISNGYNVSSYWIDVGSTPTSGDDIYSANLSSSTTSHSVSGLPTDGSTIYVRLYYNAAYDYVSYQFTTSGGSSNNTLPEITSHVNGGTLSGSTVNFSWISNGYNVSSYWVDVGSTPTSGDDIYSANLSSSTTSHSVSGLPTDGSTIYVRLYYNAAYDYVTYQFTTGN